MIIEKKARDLQPGDILPDTRSDYRSVVVNVTHDEDNVNMYTVRVGGPLHPPCLCCWNAETIVEVEVPDLTPAQQHAGELLSYAKIYHGNMVLNGAKDKPDIVALRLLLDKIEPPQPPTLDEALQALASMMKGPAFDQSKASWREHLEGVKAIVERAKRAGLLPADPPPIPPMPMSPWPGSK